jgi:DNA ligase-1
MSYTQKLFKRTSKGALQEWTIVQEGNQFHTIEGQVDGKLTTTKPTICSPKNVGKSSETTGEQQALSEAQAKAKLKMDKGYVTDINEVDTSDAFTPMLAKEYNKFNHKVKYPCAVQPKFDGVRSNTTLSTGQLSREGRPQLSAPHLFEAIKPLVGENDDVVIDGEIYNHELKHDFDRIISLARKSKPTPEDLAESANVLEYHIYDIFFKNHPDMLFFDRLGILKQTMSQPNVSNKLVMCPTYIVNNETELDAKYEEFLEMGYEGMMIRNNVPYQQKRTDNLLKRKEFQDAEFEILDILEGVGNRSGMAGTILLKLNDNGDTFNSTAMGGEEYYKELLTNKNKYIGKLATVKFQNYTPAGVPRFPTIKAIRDYE